MPDVALHSGKVVRLENQNAGAPRHIEPAANDLHAVAGVRPLLRRHCYPFLEYRQPLILMNIPSDPEFHGSLLFGINSIGLADDTEARASACPSEGQIDRARNRAPLNGTISA